jgi:hypothetical protein
MSKNPKCSPESPELSCQLALLLLALVVMGCSTANKMTQPDFNEFEKVVASTSLRDSLRQGKLVPGMPYFVAETLFSNWQVRRHIPVASVGSKQELKEVEGWGRQYVDPNIRVFMEEYNTDVGTLTLWYQYPDFYRMNVSAGDTLYVFSKGRVFSSLVGCLRSSDAIRVKDTLKTVPKGDTLYCEIHFVENPRSPLNSSYWYLMRLLSDSQTFTLMPPSFRFYPIDQIELEGDRVPSFQWSKLP